MGGVAAVLVGLTVLDYSAGPSSVPKSKTSSAARADGPAPARSASSPEAPDATQDSPTSVSTTRDTDTSEEMRFLAALRHNAAIVTERYQTAAVPYAEMMGHVAVSFAAGEKPEEATKRSITDLIPPTVRITTLLVAEGGKTAQDPLLSVSLALESNDSEAMQEVVLKLGDPAAGLIWREMSLVADSSKHLLSLSGVISVLPLRYAE